MGYTKKSIEEMNCMDDFLMNAVAGDPEVKDRLMDFEEYIWLLKKETEKETIVANILELLEDYGEIPEDLRQELAQTKDIDLLKRYHKLAAKVSSIEEFTARRDKM